MDTTHLLPVLGVLCRAKTREGVGMPVCVASMVLKIELAEVVRDALDELERRELIWCVRKLTGHITSAGPTWLGYAVGRLHGYALDDTSNDERGTAAVEPVFDARPPLTGVSIAARHGQVEALQAIRSHKR